MDFLLPILVIVVPFHPPDPL